MTAAGRRRAATKTRNRVVKTSILVSAFAVAGTGAAVVGGVVLGGGSSSAEALPGTVGGGVAQDRPAELSRASSRQAASTADTKSALLAAAGSGGSAITGSEDLTPVAPVIATGNVGDEQAYAAALLPSFGWDDSQFGCLVNLWNRESNWRVNAGNPTSGAYGIPQALPGPKMAAAGSDWATNYETQIRWGLGYIHDRYGSPCGAWAHSESSGWY